MIIEVDHGGDLAQLNNTFYIFLHNNNAATLSSIHQPLSSSVRYAPTESAIT